MNKYQQVDLVVTTRRGKKRTYAINRITSGPESWDFIQTMIAAFEKTSLRHTIPYRHKNRL